SAGGVVTRYQYFPSNDPNGASSGVSPVTTPDQPTGHLFRTTIDSATPPPPPVTVTRSPSLTPPEERSIDHFYDVHGYLSAISDPKRLTTAVHFDELGILKQRIAPDGSTLDFKHDANGQLIAETANIKDVEFPIGVVLPRPSNPLPTQVTSGFSYDRIGNK